VGHPCCTKFGPQGRLDLFTHPQIVRRRYPISDKST
jgi:hypothetical protein